MMSIFKDTQDNNLSYNIPDQEKKRCDNRGAFFWAIGILWILSR